MRTPLRRTFSRFLDLPDFPAQADPASATEANPRFDFRFVRATASGDPDEADLWSVVELSDRNQHIRRANPDLSRERRAALYSLWFRANPHGFLLLERTPADKHGVRIVGNTAMLALEEMTFERIKLNQIAAIDLLQRDIRGSGEPFDILLFDTWVMNDDYQDFHRSLIRRLFGGKSHFGYGNALVLRHLALFWNPAGNAKLRLAVEPDSTSVDAILRRTGFEDRGKTKIKKPLYEIEVPPPGPETIDNALLRRHIRDVVNNIATCSAWVLAR